MCHTVFHSMCYVTKRLDPWNVNRPAWCIVQFCSHHLIKNVHCLLRVSFQVIKYRRFGSATFWTPKPGNETQLSTLFFSRLIHLTFNYCCYNMSMPHTVHFLPKPKWLNYLSNPNTDKKPPKKKKPSGMIDITHRCEQGVPCYETGCDWLRVEKGIPIGLKQAHSFTLRCLLCNPMGCHGDHMLLQVNMAQSQKTRFLTRKQRNKTCTCFIGRENKVCVCLHSLLRGRWWDTR